MTGWLVKCSRCGLRVSRWDMHKDVDGVLQAVCADCTAIEQEATEENENG